MTDLSRAAYLYLLFAPPAKFLLFQTCGTSERAFAVQRPPSKGKKSSKEGHRKWPFSEIGATQRDRHDNFNFNNSNNIWQSEEIKRTPVV